MTNGFRPLLPGQYTPPANEVIVNSEADLPAPVGDVITLEDNTSYKIGSSFSTNNRIVVGLNNSIFAHNIGTVITINNTGNAISGGDFGLFSASSCSFNAPLSPSLFNFEDVISPNTSTVVFDGASAFVCQNYCTVNNIRIIGLNASGVFTDCDSGLILVGNNIAVSFRDGGFVSDNPAFVGIDLGTGLCDIEVRAMTLIGVAGSTGISGLANSGNIPVGQLANVSDCSFTGITNPLSGINEQDIRFDFSNNNAIPDSNKDADMYLTATQTVTNPGVGTFADINGVNWASDVSNRFSFLNTGSLTYLSEGDDNFNITASATIEKTGGGSDELALRIAVNGTSIAKTQVVTQNNQPTSLSAQGIITLSQNDVVTVQVANLDSSGPNTIVYNCNLIVD